MTQGSFRIRPLLLGALSGVLLIVFAFLALNYYRAASFDASLLASCAGLEVRRSSACAGWTVYAYMGDRHWLAMQFSVYVLLAWACGLAVGLRLPSAPRRAGALVGALTAILLLVLLEPGRLPALAALSGASLGGLMASSRLRRRRT